MILVTYVHVYVNMYIYIYISCACILYICDLLLVVLIDISPLNVYDAFQTYMIISVPEANILDIAMIGLTHCGLVTDAVMAT